MKWINHQIVTGFIVCTATNDALFTASAIVGAVLPDRVEGSPPKDNSAYWKWRKKHRTWSHYPLIYLALIGAAQLAKEYYPEPTLDFALNLNLRAYRSIVAHRGGRNLREGADFHAA